ncbi:MAG: AAA family ATPase, partial [Bradymonadaceae bacterium]
MSDAPAILSENTPQPSGSEPIQQEDLDRLREQVDRIKKEIGRIFIGPDRVIESLLVALFARGHILLEGVPGVAKTTLCRTFAQTVDADFRRIQFTPDLLPSDITGTYIPNLQTNQFVLRKGPIFAHIVLADEINRAPAKTQSALLEAMGERQISVGATTHPLPSLFLVMATQNPIEQEGTYPLPEAQLDRFLMHVTIDYPDAASERKILQLARREANAQNKAQAPAAATHISQAQIFAAREQVLNLHMIP